MPVFIWVFAHLSLVSPHWSVFSEPHSSMGARGYKCGSGNNKFQETSVESVVLRDRLVFADHFQSVPKRLCPSPDLKQVIWPEKSRQFSRRIQAR